MKKLYSLMSNLTVFKLIFVVSLLAQSVYAKCTDKPECFKKSFFNFNFPEPNMFPIKGTSSQTLDYSVKAYGDFNNDLKTDFVALTAQNQVFIFVWNSDTFLYEKVFNQSIVMNCKPKSIYLYDVNIDGKLDFTVWGSDQKDNKSCIIPFVRSEAQSNPYIYKNETILLMDQTSDPTLIAHKFEDGMDGMGFLVYMNKSRKFLKYQQKQSNASYLIMDWSQLTQDGQTHQNIAFKDPHYNSYLDLTEDCVPDLVILNQKDEFQFWIGKNNKFTLSQSDKIQINKNDKFITFSFTDLNYDGTADLVLAFQKFIRVYLNKKTLQFDSQFCCKQCTTVQFDMKFIDIFMPDNKTLKSQGLHFGDIDIDGYPDLLMILTDIDGKQTVELFQNKFDSDNTFTSFQTPNYNGPLVSNSPTGTILSASFLDILENGILDIVISSKVAGKVQTQMIYNNFMCQNHYFIKGYGMIGNDTQNGTQYPSMSFYWINSVNDGFKITYQAQAIQTSYDALQMPYTYCGLGRANNYVQSFTAGRNGVKQQWSPIIPNSQLGVFTINGDTEEWQIRIFSFPLNQLIAVIIVSAIVLLCFGLILMYSKCKTYKKKDQSLEIQFIS